MATIERAIDVDVPVTAAFMAWTRYEDYPRFMEGVERVERLTGDRLVWHGQFQGRDEQWDVRILEEIPDLLLSWESHSRRHTSGTVTFSDEGGRTRISVVLEYDPEGIDARVGDHREFMAERLEGDLERFKLVIEERHRDVIGQGEVAFRP